jgi:hypothetical protein
LVRNLFLKTTWGINNRVPRDVKLSADVPADEDFICVKSALFGDQINVRTYIEMEFRICVVLRSPVINIWGRYVSYLAQPGAGEVKTKSKSFVTHMPVYLITTSLH